MRIQDGMGRGLEAAVDERHRLEVHATTFTEYHFASDDGRSFVTYTRHNIQAADTNEPLFFFRNEGDRPIRIERIVFSSNGDAKFECFFNTTYTSGGTERTPHNTNRTSSQESTVFVRDNDSNDLVVSGDVTANEFLDCRMDISTFSYEFDGSLVLGNDDTLFCKGEAAAIGTTMRAVVYFFIEEAA